MVSKHLLYGEMTTSTPETDGALAFILSASRRYFFSDVDLSLAGNSYESTPTFQ